MSTDRQGESPGSAWDSPSPFTSRTQAHTQINNDTHANLCQAASHLCDSGVISGVTFRLWVTVTSMNICTPALYVCLFIITSMRVFFPCCTLSVLWFISLQYTSIITQSSACLPVHLMSLLPLTTNKSSVNKPLLSTPVMTAVLQRPVL